MKKNRSAFLATLASGSVGLSITAARPASAQSAAPPPSSSASPKPPSSSAAALAAEMRAFSSALTHEQIDAIARGIDANRASAAALRGKKRRLRDSDEPVVVFRVPDGAA